jgi:hypothetical protein
MVLYILGWLQAIIIILLGIVGFWVKQFVNSTNKFIHQVIRLETLFESQQKSCHSTHAWLDKRLDEACRKSEEAKEIAEMTEKEIIKIKEHF